MTVVNNLSLDRVIERCYNRGQTTEIVVKVQVTRLGKGLKDPAFDSVIVLLYN